MLRDLALDPSKPECKLADIYAYISIIDHTLTSIEIWIDSERAVVLSHIHF